LQSVPNLRLVNDRLQISDDQQLVLASGEKLEADLIVVATGQNLSLKRFVVEEKRTPLQLAYRSVVFLQKELRMPEGSRQYYYQADRRLAPLGGVICPIEDGKAIATMIEYDTTLSRLDKTMKEFLKKAGSVGDGRFFHIIENARPLSPVNLYLKKDMYRRRLRLPLENIVFLGDAICSLNPAFGQGMTLALQQAELLDRLLQTGEFSNRELAQGLRTLARQPYYLALLGSRKGGLAKNGLDAYLRLCRRFPSLHHRFLKKLHLTADSPPSARQWKERTA
jgi:2-polyprenyl-6-methoxyphenol hydroxylase-like FAD-dependent oxidoreductase